MPERHFTVRVPSCALALAVAAMAPGCGGGDMRGSSREGSAVQGPADTHCAMRDGGSAFQPTSAGACGASDGGMGGGPVSTSYGETRFNASSFDDDCKYRLTWSSTTIRENADVTFSVSVVSATTGAPVAGAGLYPEVFLSETHPAPNTGARLVEVAGGVYTAGPVRFDAPGRWTVRFHLFEACSDFAPDSPHGHAAYFVDVP